jgi:branched-chain amino acid transport system permease protein
MTDLFDQYQYTIYAAVFLSYLALSAFLLLRTGVLSVAAPAFMAIGAYASALASVRWHLPFPIGLALGIALAAGAGGLVALPALRLGALFLTLMTFAIVQIVSTAITVLPFTGGAGGLSGIPARTNAAWVLGSFVIICAGLWRLTRSQGYRMMAAIQQSELGAASIGIRIGHVRFIVFLLSGALAGLAGGLAAHQDLFVTPDDYGFTMIIAMLAALFLGGPRSWLGPVLGAVVVTFLPELLRPLAAARDYVYGAIFVVFLIWAPGGAVGLISRLLQGRRLPFRHRDAEARTG